MDISLNITSKPQPIRSKPEKNKKNSKPAVKKKLSSMTANLFAFNFGTERKVKAIVARKRSTVVKKIANKSDIAGKKLSPIVDATKTTTTETIKTATPKKSIALKRKAAVVEKTSMYQKSTPAKKSLLEEDSSSRRGRSIDQKSTLVKTPSKSPDKHPVSSGDDLCLNVFVKAPSENEKPKKPKLNRFERIKQKREQRQNGGKLPVGRAFSEKELKEGLKRFSENPNKKPRVADIFDAEEKKKKRENMTRKIQSSTSEAAFTDGSIEESSKTESTTEYGDVNPDARKTNAFRVKRAEDSSVKAVDLFRDNPEARELGQRFVKPIPERIFDGTKVETLKLHPHTIKNLADLLSIKELTTVQKKTIPKALEGKDVLVRSQTGSGKTLAYALPVVEKLQSLTPKITRDTGVLAVVIVPTRELVIQTYELFQKLLKPFTWIVPGMLMGGEKRKAEKARLRKGINVLVGTPGRLVDHLLHTASFKLDKAKFLVLDEADRLLELGYERDVQQIIEAMAKQQKEFNPNATESVQRMLLSATLTPAVQRLAGLTLQDPVYIDNSEEDSKQALSSTNGYAKDLIQFMDLFDDEIGILTIPDNLEMNFLVVPPKLRLVTLAGLLAKEFSGKPKFKAIVFMSTMEMVNYHHDLLNEQLTQKILDEDDEEAAKENEDGAGDSDALLKTLRFFKLQGAMTQTERQGVFKSFRECNTGVLIATDVFGRGIDIPDINLVVQYSPPQFIADFVHRAGRTARAGRKGRAIIFLAPNEAQFVRHLEEKRIRLSQVHMGTYLNAIKFADKEAKTVQEAASNLQHKFQELVEDDREMHTKACKAFVSWVKFYSTFPKELKPIFNVTKAHMGHFAKSFALKDTPKSFVNKYTAPKAAPPTNRLTYTERDPEKVKMERRSKQRRFTTTVTNEVRNAKRTTMGTEKTFVPNRLIRMLPNSLALTTSEFDSGMPSIKKRKSNS